MIPILSDAEVLQAIRQRKYSAQETYLAMYSSWYGGIIKDPALMMLPLDDHMAHRGDAVFEAMKTASGAIYLLDEHLERLMRSAGQISIKTKKSKDEICHIILSTWRASGVAEVIIRLFLSRGPGTFSTNPYDSIGDQLYVVVTRLGQVAEEKYENGVKIGRSQIGQKDPWFARIKSCNYLPNVLMKKEAVDRGLDFTVGFAADGYLTEGSTENLILLTQEGDLLCPSLDRILRGTTMNRVFELAQKLKQDQSLRQIGERAIVEADLRSAREVMMVGTTLDVLPVVEYENQKINNGRVGPVARKLLELLRQDMKDGPKRTVL